MEISTILDHIDGGHIALPEFQRGYVWKREQVRGLFHSLYKRHPAGGLLMWATDSGSAQFRGKGSLAPGVVKLLLDGQQRITSLYGVVRGRPPEFFDGDDRAFTGLRFHLEQETFEFYQPLKMRNDPLWIDVTILLTRRKEEFENLLMNPAIAKKAAEYSVRINGILSILNINFHVDEITGPDKTLDEVVEIFNCVNSSGTKLSKGDLALAKICVDWPEARDTMKEKLKAWAKDGYDFNLDWLLRSVNTVLTGKAKFESLHDKNAEEVQGTLKRACEHIDACLNMVSGRLGLDHGRVLFGRFGVPVMVRYLDQLEGALNEIERDKLLFWFAHAGMHGRFSSSTESLIDQDLAALADGGLDKLIKQLHQWRGDLQAIPGYFLSHGKGARFYPVLYMLTRMGESRDWRTGLPLKAGLVGKMNRLEVHHIFPKSRLKDENFKQDKVNALGNFCLLTKSTNLDITNRLPEEYFPEIEEKHPGALISQWIPEDPELWKMANYTEFLKARRKLLSEELNKRMKSLLPRDYQRVNKTEYDGNRKADDKNIMVEVVGGIADEEEERQLEEVNTWVEEKGLARGELSYDLSDKVTGQLAVLDLVWDQGLQAELTQPVALLLNDEANAALAIANGAGFRCFNSINALKDYINSEILAEDRSLSE